MCYFKNSLYCSDCINYHKCASVGSRNYHYCPVEEDEKVPHKKSKWDRQQQEEANYAFTLHERIGRGRW